jgi:hypothetical protein
MFKVGDKVVDTLTEKVGGVVAIERGHFYPVKVRFADSSGNSFTLDGKAWIDDETSRLQLVKETEQKGLAWIDKVPAKKAQPSAEAKVGYNFKAKVEAVDYERMIKENPNTKAFNVKFGDKDYILFNLDYILSAIKKYKLAIEKPIAGLPQFCRVPPNASLPEGWHLTHKSINYERVVAAIAAIKRAKEAAKSRINVKVVPLI